ncbi:hypothetical protein ACFVAJ_17420 [Agromyces sp. NPDC057679]|uniref:hypothetical protein n=1 Tax=Agromyces sp. NPDC057679 TaxID=3346207 RepID=UPI00366FB1DB
MTGITPRPVGGHIIPIGAHVQVCRQGVVQPWKVTVFRHDRNRTYRLHFADTDTYVTAHEEELTVIEAPTTN